MAMIKGTSVVLFTTIPGDKDPFGRTEYRTEPVEVENVLISPTSESEILDTLNLTGRRAIYTLGIPKNDTHDWVDKDVEFWGQRFHTIGMPISGMDKLVPLDWNMKVRVEQINGGKNRT